MADDIDFADATEPLSAALRRAIGQIDGRPVTLRQVFAMLGEQGFLFICVLLTLPFLVPVSIPGVSTVFGAAIILLGVAITLNRLPWIPARLMDRAIDGARLAPVLRRGAALVGRLDRLLRPRLRGLTDGAAVARLNGLGLTYGGVLLMFPLGFVPFSNTLPGVAVMALGVGMLQRDGVAVAAGHALLAASTLYFAALAWAAFAAGQSLFGG